MIHTKNYENLSTILSKLRPKYCRSLFSDTVYIHCAHKQSQRIYRQACAKRSHAGIVFTQWSKNGVFAPQGRHVAPMNVKFGTAPHGKFHVYRGKNVGTQPPKLSKFRILAINLPLGSLVCTISTKFSAFVRVSR